MFKVKNMDEYVYVKQATKQCYIRCKVGGGQLICHIPIAKQDEDECKMEE